MRNPTLLLTKGVFCVRTDLPCEYQEIRTSTSPASLVTNIVGTFNASRRACWPRTRPSQAGSARSVSNFFSSLRKASDINYV